MHNPYCGYLVLIFEKLEKFRFFLGVSKKEYLIFLTFRMPTETSFSTFRRGHFFCGHDIKKKQTNKNRKEENLGKRESKCIQKDFLIPIYKIFLPKIS